MRDEEAGTTLCPLCEEGSLTESQTTNSVGYNSVEGSIAKQVSICNCCGIVQMTPEQSRFNKRQMLVFRKRVDGLLSGMEIKNYPACRCGDKTDGCGGSLTYENQACMPLNGVVRSIDWCIHQIVAALNAGGIETFACCCGHGEKEGSIVLVDGRELLIREYQSIIEKDVTPTKVTLTP